VIKILFSLVLILWGSLSNAAERQYTVEQVFVNQGDSLTWANQDYDDSHWVTVQSSPAITKEKNYWFRFHISIEDVLSSEQSSQLFFHHIGSAEIYWNGVLIHRNGKVGLNKAEEVPGKMDTLLVIPQTLYQQGSHVVAIRVSRHHLTHNKSLLKTNLASGYDFLIGTYGQVHTQHTGKALLPLITLGGALVVAGYFFFIFLIDQKQLSSLFFSLTCIGVVGMLLGETWRGLHNYDYDWHVVRLQTILSFSTLLGLSLPWTVYHHFSQLSERLPLMKEALILYSLLMIVFLNVTLGYDFRSAMVVILGLFIALAISFFALKNRLTGAISMTIGLSLCLLSAAVNPSLFLNETFYYTFPIMTFFFMTSIATRNKENKQQRDQALIQSERLKIELLKKNIHPHFLLNSLTTLSSWITIDVKVANKMILALAQEFRSLIALSAHDRVSLSDELTLCRSHLEIMGYRKDQSFELNVTGEKDNLLLPPGILHTLLENALSHNRYIETIVVFELKVLLSDNQVQLQLSIPESNNRNNDGQSDSSSISAGTGTQYIKARLTEAYAQDWYFDSNLTNNYWLTTLCFPAEFSQ